MILAIDAGNSRVKWGWHDGSGWSSLATVSLIEFAAANHDINPFAATHENPERIVISNVAGDDAHQLLINWTSIFDAEDRKSTRLNSSHSLTSRMPSSA